MLLDLKVVMWLRSQSFQFSGRWEVIIYVFDEVLCTIWYANVQ